MNYALEKEAKGLRNRIKLAESLPEPVRSRFRAQAQQFKTRLQEIDQLLLKEKQDEISAKITKCFGIWGGYDSKVIEHLRYSGEIVPLEAELHQCFLLGDVDSAESLLRQISGILSSIDRECRGKSA